MRLQSGSCHGIAGGGWCPGVRLIYGIFGGATVHGDVAYSTQICSLYESQSSLFCGLKTSWNAVVGTKSRRGDPGFEL